MNKSLRDPRLTAINFVADAVSRPLDLKEVADNALHAILSVMQLDVGALYVRQPPATGFVLFASRGLPAALAEAAAVNELVEPLLKEAGFGTVIVAPVLTGGEGKALLALAARVARPMTEADRELVEVMANQIGNAMMHAQLQADLRLKNKLLEVLIEEAHHRIKNNLQMISGLLEIQMADGRDAATGAALRTAITRIQAIAQVHNLLSAEMPEQVDADQLIEAVVHSVVSTARAGRGRDPQVALALRPLRLEADQAVAVALIVNELVANALLHGRAATGTGLQVRVTCDRDGADGVIEVAVNGGGSPADCEPGQGQGMNIIRQLARVNLRGSLTLTGHAAGLSGRLRFPIVP